MNPIIFARFHFVATSQFPLNDKRQSHHTSKEEGKQAFIRQTLVVTRTCDYKVKAKVQMSTNGRKNPFGKRMICVDKSRVSIYNELAWFRKKGGFICEEDISTE